MVGWFGEKLALVLALPPSRAWSQLPQIPCLNLVVISALTWRPLLHVFTSKPEHGWGAQLMLGKLFLPEPGWHLPLEAAPKGLQFQNNPALLSRGSLSLSRISRGDHRPKAGSKQNKAD